MADTRKYDLMQLYEARHNAKSVYDRDMVDQTMDRIVRESWETRGLREELVMAVRHSDKRAIRIIQEKLMRIRQEKTGGRSIS